MHNPVITASAEHNETGVPVMVFKDVTKTFGKYVAVKDVNLTIMRGEVFGFLGPNGAGKTTSIRMLLDVLRPTSGTITLFGGPARSTVSTHQRIGFLSGDMVIDENLTGRQYLSFVAHAYGKDCDAAISRLAEALQANVAVRIGNYSRGNKQKIGLIAALMHEPELLVLDEPTSGFDPLVQETFATLIREYRAGGGTVFMSSHILSEVQELCDRLAFIKDGRILTVTATNQLTAQAAKRVKIVAPAGVIRAIELKHPQTLKLEQSSAKHELHATYQGKIQPLLQFLAVHEVQDVSIRDPELEEIFMHYYQDGQTDTGKNDV